MPTPSSLLHKPNEAKVRQIISTLAPWRWLVQPVFSGLNHIPDERPLLFVGNHTLFGVLDVPIMYAELFKRRGIILRGLAHHLHFAIPAWREFLTRYGVVEGTRENCAALMSSGESILVFPGGDREVAKRKGEKYTLIWNDRVGFAKMAINHGCTIIPFGAVGVEDAFDIRVDANEILASPLGPIVNKLGIPPKLIPPFATGVGPTMIPRPHRLYFHFGEPISTHQFRDADNLHDASLKLRDEVKDAVEDAIARMQRKRDADPETSIGRRVAYAFKQWRKNSRES